MEPNIILARPDMTSLTLAVPLRPADEGATVAATEEQEDIDLVTREIVSLLSPSLYREMR